MDPKLKQEVRPDEQAMLDAVCGSAHQIWQAGLGAFARAQQEGGDLFAKLVQDGVELQKMTQRLSGEKGFSVTDTVTRLAENASRQASGSWDKLEKVFEDRVSRSLRALGAPSAAEVQALSREVTELKAALRIAGERSQHDIDALRDALGRAVAELRAAPGSTGKKRAVALKASTAARPAAKAAPKAPPKVAAKVVAKAGAKGTAAKRAPAKKAPRSAPRAA